jgi:hypothetical protein
MCGSKALFKARKSFERRRVWVFSLHDGETKVIGAPFEDSKSTVANEDANNDTHLGCSSGASKNCRRRLDTSTTDRLDIDDEPQIPPSK